MHQWFTLKEVAEKQKACPLSVGQAEAGRYTFCIGEQCMAWKWNQDQVVEAQKNIISIPVDEDIPEGYETICEPYETEEDEVKFVDVMKKPTHGRCGMVP